MRWARQAAFNHWENKGAGAALSHGGVRITTAMWSPLSGTQDDTGATKLQAWTKPTLSLGLPLDKIFRNSFPSLVSPHSELRPLLAGFQSHHVFVAIIWCCHPVHLFLPVCKINLNLQADVNGLRPHLTQ